VRPHFERSHRAVLLATAAATLLAGAVRLPGLGARGLGSARAPSAVAGTLSAGLGALVGGAVAGPAGATGAGVILALVPIHVLASREAGTETTLVFLVLLALALAARAPATGTASALALGATVGLLWTAGVAAAAVAALAPLAWLALRPDRRGHAGLATVAALAAAAGVAALGLARSPFDLGEIPSWIPEATASGVVRCAGASFTRLAGLEYHLLVAHARAVLPLTLLLVALMVLGARRLERPARWAFAGGAVVPFALGAALALATGRVAPLQAGRLLATLPFLAVLTAAGFASLRGRAAKAVALAVAVTLSAFLALALARSGGRAGAAPPGGQSNSRTGADWSGPTRPAAMSALR
jgi:hypothetical protein